MLVSTCYHVYGQDCSRANSTIATLVGGGSLPPADGVSASLAKLVKPVSASYVSDKLVFVDAGLNQVYMVMPPPIGSTFISGSVYNGTCTNANPNFLSYSSVVENTCIPSLNEKRSIHYQAYKCSNSQCVTFKDPYCLFQDFTAAPFSYSSATSCVNSPSQSYSDVNLVVKNVQRGLPSFQGGLLTV